MTKTKANTNVNTGSTAWLVTRHPGAVDWARQIGLRFDQHVPHLDVRDIQPGDTVIGSLPVHLAAEVCGRGARYFNLSIDLPHSMRGRELAATELQSVNARLEEFCVVRTETDCKFAKPEGAANRL